MNHTLIAVFDKRADAQSAMDELLLSSFSRDAVRLSEDTITTGEPTISDETEEQGIGATLKHFFLDLFGSDTDVHGRKYETAVNKGHHVLTITASDDDVERAADIVERFGPVDIDEKVAEWGGYSHPIPESMRMGGAGGMQQSQGASLQFHDDRHLFAQQSLNDERPMGYTYQETMGSGDQLSVGRFANVRRGVRMFSPLAEGESGMEDDTYYRNHWDSTYSASGKAYDDYAPAYSYGHEVANMYRGQPWNDVEMDVRKGWDSRNTTGGVSTWEQFKDAIRHGWNRLTH